MKSLRIQSSLKRNSNEISTGNSTPQLVGSVFVILFFWYSATSALNIIDPIFLPAPQDVIKSAVNLFTRFHFLEDIIVTTMRVMVAFVLSIIVAFPIALLVNKFSKIRNIFLPYVDFFRYIPVPVLIPLTILFFGLGETSKISILILGTVFQLILLFIEALDNMPHEYSDLAFTLNFSKTKSLIMKIRYSLPSFYNDARISLAICWSYVVIAELVSAEAGIGHMIKESQRFSNTANIYVAIITMALIGFISDFILRRLYHRLFPYNK